MLLDLVLTNTERLGGDVNAGSSLGYREHKITEFRILQGGSRAISKISRDLLGRNWVMGPCTWRGTTPCSGRSLGLTCWKVALKNWIRNRTQ